MFHSATIRLTLWYLLIIMLLSVLFSIAFYQVSTAEIDRSLRRQEVIYETGPFQAFRQLPDDFVDARTKQLEESKANIRDNLITINIVVLILAGGASYFLSRRTLRPIEEALESQNRFTADASHELRTPLAAMKTELEVALRDKKLSLDESKKLHESNLEEIAKLEALSHGLLKLAQQNGKQTKSDFAKTDLHEVAEEARKKVLALAQEKETELTVAGPNTLIDGEATALQEVFTILLENAIKYSPKKSKVSLVIAENAKDATIQIRDNGIGIKSTDLPHIFDRFYRADTSRSKENTNGYGLGLSIAKSIIEAHQGKISVESELEKGSIFTMVIPKTQKQSILPKNA